MALSRSSFLSALPRPKNPLLGFTEHDGARYAVVRSFKQERTGTITHLEVIARIIRGGKPQARTPKSERADPLAGEKVLIHFPVERGNAVSAWYILEPHGANQFLPAYIYYAVEILKPEEAAQVAQAIISSQPFYRHDKVLPFRAFPNKDVQTEQASL